MSPIDLVPLATFLGIIGLSIWCWARIASKAGYSGAWGLVAVVPILNVAALCVFAFARWPALPQELGHE